MSLVLAFVSYVVLVLLFAFTITTGDVNDINLSRCIYYLSFFVWISFIIYCFVVFLHHRIVLHFECVDDIDNLKIKRVGKIVGKVIIFVSFISALVTILQPFVLKK